MSALYDSVLFGMHYYVAHHTECLDVDLGDAAGVFHELAQQGVFDDEHAFERLSLTVERILWQGPDCFDANALILEVEEMLTKLGVFVPRKYIRPENEISQTNRKEGDAYFQTA